MSVIGLLCGIGSYLFNPKQGKHNNTKLLYLNYKIPKLTPNYYILIIKYTSFYCIACITKYVAAKNKKK